MVQNFAFFADRRTSAKITTAKCLIWHRVRVQHAGRREIKIFSGGLGGEFTKNCTSENFPLYGITTMKCMLCIVSGDHVLHSVTKMTSDRSKQPFCFCSACMQIYLRGERVHGDQLLHAFNIIHNYGMHMLAMI